MTRRSRDILCDGYGLEGTKVRTIPHGVPAVAFRAPGQIPWERNGEGPSVIRVISLGLLRPAKGIEEALAALAQVKPVFPRFGISSVAVTTREIRTRRNTAERSSISSKRSGCRTMLYS